MIEAQAITGSAKGNAGLTSRHLEPSDSVLPFVWRTLQFTLKPAFAISI